MTYLPHAQTVAAGDLSHRKRGKQERPAESAPHARHQGHDDPDFLAQSWKKAPLHLHQQAVRNSLCQEIPSALPEIMDCGKTIYKEGSA